VNAHLVGHGGGLGPDLSAAKWKRGKGRGQKLVVESQILKDKHRRIGTDGGGGDTNRARSRRGGIAGSRGIDAGEAQAATGRALGAQLVALDATALAAEAAE